MAQRSMKQRELFPKKVIREMERTWEKNIPAKKNSLEEFAKYAVSLEEGKPGFTEAGLKKLAIEHSKWTAKTEPRRNALKKSLKAFETLPAEERNRLIKQFPYPDGGIDRVAMMEAERARRAAANPERVAKYAEEQAPVRARAKAAVEEKAMIERAAVEAARARNTEDLRKAANEAGLAAREERLRMQLRGDIKAAEPARRAETARTQARRAGGEAARKAGYEVSDKFNFRDSISVNDPRPFTKFEKLQGTVDKYFPEPSKAQTRVMDARRVAGPLGAALASMGAAGMADEGWAAGMASGGGKGGYQPVVRKRTPYSTREE